MKFSFSRRDTLLIIHGGEIIFLLGGSNISRRATYLGREGGSTVPTDHGGMWSSGGSEDGTARRWSMTHQTGLVICQVVIVETINPGDVICGDGMWSLAMLPCSALFVTTIFAWSFHIGGTLREMSKMTWHLSSLYLTTTWVTTFLLWGWTEVTVLWKTSSIVIHRCGQTSLLCAIIMYMKHWGIWYDVMYCGGCEDENGIRIPSTCEGGKSEPGVQIRNAKHWQNPTCASFQKIWTYCNC